MIIRLAILSSLALFAAPFAFALNSQSKAAIDQYLLSKGIGPRITPMLKSIHTDLTTRIDSIEATTKEVQPEFEKLNIRLDHLNKESLAVTAEMKAVSPYDDKKWQQGLHSNLVHFCCELRSAPGLIPRKANRKGRMYQKLKHAGDGDIGSFQRNELRPGFHGAGAGGGAGGGRRRGGGGRRGGGAGQ